MNIRAHLTEAEMVSGKHRLPHVPVLTLWKQLLPQQQKQLAKHWAQLMRQMQPHLGRRTEVQDVEN